MTFEDLLKQMLKEVLQDVLPEILSKQEKSLPELMTLKELADYWRVTRTSIRNWVRTKGLPVRHLGGSLRFQRAEVDLWSKEQATQVAKQRRR